MSGAFRGRTEVVERLLGLEREGRLGQSHLFIGPVGSGKELTAIELARLVNCPTPDVCRAEPTCESCLKARSFQHPDIRWICPAPATITDADVTGLFQAKRADPFHQPAYAASSEVLIGDPEKPGALTVRSLLQSLRTKPFQGRCKVAIVSDAHRLRAGAANAFLKALEEPPPDALIILTSSLKAGVLPTILSRCRQTRFEAYAEGELAALLADLYGLDASTAAAYARASAGDARRAARMRLPVVQVTQAWAGQLVDALAAGRGGTAQTAADLLHKGVLPETLVDAVNAAGGDGPKLRKTAVQSLVERRERVIQLCEALHLHYSDLLGFATDATGWRPRLEASAPRLREQAAARSAANLLSDISAIERARADVDRSLNIGLVMSVLFQELIGHVEQDRTRTR